MKLTKNEFKAIIKQAIREVFAAELLPMLTEVIKDEVSLLQENKLNLPIKSNQKLQESVLSLKPARPKDAEKTLNLEAYRAKLRAAITGDENPEPANLTETIDKTQILANLDQEAGNTLPVVKTMLEMTSPLNDAEEATASGIDLMQMNKMFNRHSLKNFE